MTVSRPYEDWRRPALPYPVTVRRGRTGSIVDIYRLATMALAEAAVKRAKETGVVTDRWDWRT